MPFLVFAGAAAPFTAKISSFQTIDKGEAILNMTMINKDILSHGSQSERAKIAIHLFWSILMLAIGESREISHANVTEPQTQVARNLRLGRFTTETLQRQRRLELSASNKGEDDSKKPRCRENIAQHSKKLTGCQN